MALTQAMPHPPATTAAPLKQTYDQRFDNVDLDEILGQERLLNNYIKCLEGLGPCTPDGKMLKGKPMPQLVVYCLCSPPLILWLC